MTFLGLIKYAKNSEEAANICITLEVIAEKNPQLKSYIFTKLDEMIMSKSSNESLLAAAIRETMKVFAK